MNLPTNTTQYTLGRFYQQMDILSRAQFVYLPINYQLSTKLHWFTRGDLFLTFSQNCAQDILKVILRNVGNKINSVSVSHQYGS